MLDLRAAGPPNPAIVSKLFLSEKTVRNYVTIPMIGPAGFARVTWPGNSGKVVTDAGSTRSQ